MLIEGAEIYEALITHNDGTSLGDFIYVKLRRKSMHFIVIMTE